jgi:hypothetical protein
MVDLLIYAGWVPEVQSGRGGHGFNAVIPLKDLAPGVDVLHVERDRASPMRASAVTCSSA